MACGVVFGRGGSAKLWGSNRHVGGAFGGADGSADFKRASRAFGFGFPLELRHWVSTSGRIGGSLFANQNGGGQSGGVEFGHRIDRLGYQLSDPAISPV